MALVWVPPEMKNTSASGQAQAARILNPRFCRQAHTEGLT